MLRGSLSGGYRMLANFYEGSAPDDGAANATLMAHAREAHPLVCAALIALSARAEALEAMLREVEWTGPPAYASDFQYDGHSCPSCHIVKGGGAGQHRPGCKLAALLGADDAR